MTRPILLFGAGGQVGQELVALAAARGIGLVGLTRADGDITDAAAIARAVALYQPRLIVNAAAYTAVDRAESEAEAALAINGIGAGLLAEAADRAGIPILHLSTDYVFDGTKTGAYGVTDPIAPLGIYGGTKAEGETRVRLVPQHVILRTAWVYGRYGANFLKTMLRLAGTRDHLRVVADQRGCPTATLDIAEAVLAVTAKLAATPDPACFGTYHFAGTGVTSWHGFAEAIVAAQAGVTGKTPPVESIATSDYPTPARRPANSELDSRLFTETFGYQAAGWQARTREIVDILLTPEHPEPRQAPSS